MAISIHFSGVSIESKGKKVEMPVFQQGTKPESQLPPDKKSITTENQENISEYDTGIIL